MSNDRPSNWDTLRKRAYRRDDYTCQNCGAVGGPHGAAELHAHHTVPLHKGGSNELSNLTTLCKSCHDAVHNRNAVASTASNASTMETELRLWKNLNRDFHDNLRSGGYREPYPKIDRAVASLLRAAESQDRLAAAYHDGSGTAAVEPAVAVEYLDSIAATRAELRRLARYRFVSDVSAEEKPGLLDKLLDTPKATRDELRTAHERAYETWVGDLTDAFREWSALFDVTFRIDDRNVTIGSAGEAATADVEDLAEEALGVYVSSDPSRLEARDRLARRMGDANEEFGMNVNLKRFATMR